MFAMKKMRERAGLKQHEAAKELGVTVKCYGNWEREDREINLRDAIKVADLFDCTLDELAGREWPKGERSFADSRQRDVMEAWDSMNEDGRDFLWKGAVAARRTYDKGDRGPGIQEEVI